MIESHRSGTRKRVRTTVDLPITLRERIQEALERGVAKSQNALIVQAVERFLEDLERTWLDAQFAEMADDETYQTLQLIIAEEFAPVDWETWQAAEAGDETTHYSLSSSANNSLNVSV